MRNQFEYRMCYNNVLLSHWYYKSCDVAQPVADFYIILLLRTLCHHLLLYVSILTRDNLEEE